LSKLDYPVNEEIEAARVRVVNQDGKQIGVMSRAEALRLAEQEGLDLVMIAPQANPPVCKIMDYGRFKYEQSKKASAARKKQHQMQVKEVQVSADTGEHDLQVKLRNVRRFLQAGHKVKVAVRFRGREMKHADRGRARLEEIAEAVADLGRVEQRPNLEGRRMSMVLAPLSMKKKK